MSLVGDATRNPVSASQNRRTWNEQLTEFRYMGRGDTDIRRAESRDSYQIWRMVQDFAFSYEPEPVPSSAP